MSLHHLYGKPIEIEEVGGALAYPITLDIYDEFNLLQPIISMSFDHFEVPASDEFKKVINENQYKLLNLIALASFEEPDDNILAILKRIFELVFRVEEVYVKRLSPSEVFFMLSNDYEDKRIIHQYNYDKVREIIMTQNLLHSETVYPDEFTKKIMEMAKRVDQEDSIEMGMEEYITTVGLYMGKSPSSFSTWTIYQITSYFVRLTKFKEYDSILHSIGHAKELPKSHFAEKVDITKNPEDSLYKEPDEKLADVNKALGG